MKGVAIRYSAEELAWVEARKDWIISDLHAAFLAAFGRTDVRLVNLQSLRKRKGWRTGRTGQFTSGSTPHNKGKPFSPPGSEKGRFKKGNVPHNANYLGHERVSKDGYVEMSVDERNPHTGFERRYVLKHKWLWQQQNGAVPEGYVLKSRDGNKLNADPSNWSLIPRAMLPRLNGRFGRAYDAAAAELKPTIMAITALEHRARLKKAGNQ